MEKKKITEFQLREISEMTKIPRTSIISLNLTYDEAFKILSKIKYNPISKDMIDFEIKKLQNEISIKELENAARMRAKISNVDPNLQIYEQSIDKKFKKIPEFVYLGFLQKGKKIDEINPSLIKLGSEDQKKYSEENVWHNKKDIDRFVQRELKLSDEQIKNALYEDGKNKFWYKVAKVISNLREEGTITDWANIDQNRTGVWRLSNIEIVNRTNEEIRTNNKSDFFMITGPWRNWEHSIRNEPMLWGVKSEPSNLTIYNMMKPGDIVFFYQTLESPIYFSKRGIFGIGRVIKKRDSTIPFWPDEVKEDKIIYEKIFEIEKIKIAQNDEDIIPWIDGLPWTKGLNHIINQNSLSKLTAKISEKWKVYDLQNEISPNQGNLKRDVKFLDLPSELKIKEITSEIRKKLLVDETVIEKIIASLYSGKHVLLTGPVGTGKTDLAQSLPQIVWNYFPEIHTATADWTTQDVIGGLYPKVEEGGEMKFQIQRGCVSSTVAKNWSDETGQNGKRVTYPKKNSEGTIHDYEGVWLVIDEFNRANIDRAFGQLFTSLEYRNELKVPTTRTVDKQNPEEFDRYLIPSDYRILGTLNTYDKHFLFHLSDALKRRFDFIEVTIPERKDFEKEFDISKEKAADNELLNEQLQILLNENLETKTQLIEIFAFVRTIKQLGTAIMISIVRELLIYHKMGKSWDESLDSGFVKKIIPQLEEVSSTSLRTLYNFVNGDLGNFFIEFSVDEHPEKVSDYKKELERYRKFYKEKTGKEFSEDWSIKFEKGELNKLKSSENLDESQKNEQKNIQKELNPWGEKIPQLIDFKKSIANLIQGNELTSIGNLESEFS